VPFTGDVVAARPPRTSRTKRRSGQPHSRTHQHAEQSIPTTVERGWNTTAQQRRRAARHGPADGKHMIANLAGGMPVLMISAVVLGLVVVIALFRRGSTVAAWLALVGLILLGAVIAVTLAVEVPIDNRIKTWTTASLPADWAQIRARWAILHAVRTFLSLAGVAAVVAAALTSEPEPRTADQPTTGLPEQPRHGRLTHHEPRRVQPLHQMTEGLGRPPQRRGRITAGLRPNQSLQRLHHPRLRVLHHRAPSTYRAYPTIGHRPSPDLVHSGLHRGPRSPRHPGHQRDPAPTQRLGLSTQQQPPLPLVQVWLEDSKLLGQRALSSHTHILTTGRSHRNYNHVIHDQALSMSSGGDVRPSSTAPPRTN
jgi:hypothetical protein